MQSICVAVAYKRRRLQNLGFESQKEAWSEWRGQCFNFWDLPGDEDGHTLCPKKVIPLNILQQPPQTCTDLNEILHTQDDIYFCHRRQIS